MFQAKTSRLSCLGNGKGRHVKAAPSINRIPSPDWKHLMTNVLLALGANQTSRWGQPTQTFYHAVKQLDAIGVKLIQCSSIYRTAPTGCGLQPEFTNMAVRVSAHLSPNSLLKHIKILEIETGRKMGQHWGSRPLDIDILDFSGFQTGWPPAELQQNARFQGRRPRGRLILPHPQLHLRSFVLFPLRDIAPHWRHPVFAVSVKRLIEQLLPADRPAAGSAVAPLRSIERLTTDLNWQKA